MKNKLYDVRLHPVAGLLFLLAGVVLLSWIADCYGWYVVYTATGEEIRLQNLLSAEGIRWWLRSMVPNFLHYAHPGQAVVAAMGGGVVLHAFAGCRPLTVRKQRALTAALAVAGGYMLLVLLLAVPSWGILRGANGGLFPSPFTESLLFLLSLGTALTGAVYGALSGRYQRRGALLAGLTCAMPFLGCYFVLSFFTSQLYACVVYTRMARLLLLWWPGLSLCLPLLYALPVGLACHLYRRQRIFSAR